MQLDKTDYLFCRMQYLIPIFNVLFKLEGLVSYGPYPLARPNFLLSFIYH